MHVSQYEWPLNEYDRCSPNSAAALIFPHFLFVCTFLMLKDNCMGALKISQHYDLFVDRCAIRCVPRCVAMINGISV